MKPTHVSNLGKAGVSQIAFCQSTKYEVNEVFYECLVYENLEAIIDKYARIQKDADHKLEQ